MRSKSLTVAAFLACSTMVYAAVTVSVRESGTGQAVINGVTAGSTVNVDVIVTESGSGGISGVQFDLVAGTSGVLSVTGGAYNDAGWDNDIPTGMALPIVTGPLSTSSTGPYGSGLDVPPLADGSSTVMTLAVQVAPGTPDGPYTLNINPGSSIGCPNFPASGPVPADLAVTADSALTINVGGAPACARTVAGRAIYYNNSAWDGDTPGFVSAAQENAAIAPDKSVLLPGQLAQFANITSFSRGVNGLVIDLSPGVGCTALNGAINPANFSFMSGNDNGLGSFSPEAIVPTSITAVAGGGAGGSDRIYLTLPDQPGTNPPLNSKWLRITVKSNANGGDLDLASDDVFYVGFAKGKATAALSGDRFAVGSADKNQIQVNPKPSGTALITDPNDNNRDKAVGSTDVNNALLNPTSSVNGLKQITAP